MQDFMLCPCGTQLKVWQKAHSFTVNLYKITKNFPSEEKFPKGYRFAYGLTNQIRRASVSIESNISEGCGRNGDKEFSRFLDIAQGSPKGYRFAYACEVKCQVLIARDLGYLDVNKSEILTDTLDNNLNGGNPRNGFVSQNK